MGRLAHALIDATDDRGPDTAGGFDAARRMELHRARTSSVRHLDPRFR